MRYNNDNGKGATTIVAFAFFRFFLRVYLTNFNKGVRFYESGIGILRLYGV